MDGSIHDFVEVYLSPCLSDELTSLIETELISFFQFTIICLILLHGVVRQVDKGLGNTVVSEGELLGARPDVTFTEQVASLVIYVALVDQYPQTNVEFAAIDQKGSLDVLLQYKDL